MDPRLQRREQPRERRGEAVVLSITPQAHQSETYSDSTERAVIMLHGGAELDFLDPWSSNFTIEDVAHGLAHICRYAGQCAAFYSVAEHSLLVSETCKNHELVALMHDAAEAFVGDVTRPLKQLLPDYKKIEKNVQSAILTRFGISGVTPPEVKEADVRVLAAEQAQIMPPALSEWARKLGIEPAPVTVKFYPPSVAKERFLARFRALTTVEAS